MALPRSSLAAVVVAAGAGTRFPDRPGGKLLAPLEGRPVLLHVLGALRAFGPAATVVVLGHGSSLIERAIAWAGEVHVLNPDPGRGLSSSIQVGFAALPPDGIEGAFIVLGDQPRLRVEVLAALAAEADRSGQAIVVPRYAGDAGPRNPVLLMRPAWPLVEGLTGDVGLGALIEARPELVREVPVEGRMPDVDRPEDLAALQADAS